MSTIEMLVDEIAESFAGVAHPGGPYQVSEGPCCPDHDAVAEWLSCHTWEELARDLENSDFDPMGWPLLPRAYCYFLPGVLTYVVRNIGRDPESEEWGTRYWRPLDWIHSVLAPWPRSEHWTRWRDDLRSGPLPLLSEKQKGTVRKVLHLAAAAEHLSPEEKDDLRIAAREIWGDRG
jgi:hypothetical protein